MTPKRYLPVFPPLPLILFYILSWLGAISYTSTLIYISAFYIDIYAPGKYTPFKLLPLALKEEYVVCCFDTIILMRNVMFFLNLCQFPNHFRVPDTTSHTDRESYAHAGKNGQSWPSSLEKDIKETRKNHCST